MKNIWLDSDPGIDDAVAFAMAAASSDELNVLGITAVSGNQSSDRVTRNALRLSAMLGMDDVPVVRGAREPLIKKVADAAEFHGESGLGHFTAPATAKTVAAKNGLLYMAVSILSLPAEQKVTLVPTGPLTDIALLLKTFPDVRERIERIVFMGGSSIGGNVTDKAEFNIWADPDAAQIVLHSGIPTVMCGLDITLQCGLTKPQIAALLADTDPIKNAYGQMLSFYANVPGNEEEPLVAIHDAVTIIYLTHPELFGGKFVTVDVDCGKGAGNGETICTDAHIDADNAVYMLNEVDLPAFQRVLLGKLDTLKG
ncbi:nucleoside hydrolase [Lacticaseibacillus sharpeae]|uniref:Ribonucleoside hydrolase RihC n=1 Tax=Lacticaseibacillus sharpeae JCM 1186 = DSM 20505 TaxID=1291052 RepID=A0A0R1ZJK5_9LACO|nr:nucleoside hydrolase [Lacticaseibacillus sharpeae]KRM55150.1 ribonucleoside hydrolase RihC [Lacticaseibacillus sharpeae JCM 1186 = DSM 20505]